jgi:DNA mismatch repair ATPase MutS
VAVIQHTNEEDRALCRRINKPGHAKFELHVAAYFMSKSKVLPRLGQCASGLLRASSRHAKPLTSANANIRGDRLFHHDGRTLNGLGRLRPARGKYVRSSAVTGRRLGHRGKKTKTVVQLEDLPQGRIALDPLPPPTEQDDGPAYPTVVLQARRNMARFENCVLLTRVGGFYELYFDQAEEFGPLLNLKVAQKKTNAGPVPMAGFPFFQLDRFLKILVQDLNRYVAIAEEFPNTAADKVKSGGLMHDRRVARIITPGTLIDENFMDPYANNYVMAAHVVPEAADEAQRPGDQKLGLAWLDLSTGQFFTQEASLASFSSTLSRVSPKEVVLDQELRSSGERQIADLLGEDRHVVTYAPSGSFQGTSDWTPMLESEIPAQTLDSFTNAEVSAGSFLLNYVKDRLQGLSMKLQPPQRQETVRVMNIDKSTMRSLEIRQTIRDSTFRGSLLHAIRRTTTRSGARLLNEWLGAPSTSLEAINSRQDLVAAFVEDTDLSGSIISLLKRCHDSQRLVQKLAMGRGGPDELLGLASTIRATEDIAVLLKGSDEHSCLREMADRINIEAPRKLADRIREAIDEEGLLQQHELEDEEAGEMLALAREVASAEGTKADESSLPKAAAKRKKATSIREYYGEDNEPWIMKPAASVGLQRLHDELELLQEQKTELGQTLRERLGAASLTLRWTPGLGHICHVKGKDMRSDSLENTRTLSSSRTTRSFHVPEWTRLGEQLDKTRYQIRGEEQRVLHDLRERVVLNLVKLRRNAAVLDELDIASSFASLAIEQGLVRPTLNDGTAHKIAGGRHPTVEGGLHEQGRTFQRNDCYVGEPQHGRLWLITGPNMAGKSTFLRQNSLITILAQIGCYVPADYAELGIVDAIFSRVGSADNLYRDQSTFMVEMLETAQILRQATPRSFVIMDEIGRGTTPEDGTAVAFACLHHLVHVNKSRVLFATHFHTLTDLVQEQHLHVGDGETNAVEMYCTDVIEDQKGGFIYDHRLQRGINRQSHALKVARLANLPESAIQTAREVLERFGHGEAALDVRHGNDGGTVAVASEG